jgi:hypothetical protein
MTINKAKMIEDLKRKMELGTQSDLYNCPDNAPEFMPFTIAAMALTDELKEVAPKVLELIQKSIEHDLLMSQAMKQAMPKKSFWRRLWK